MATVPSSTTRRGRLFGDATASEAPAEKSAPAPSKRKRRLLLGAAALVVLLVWLAPMIVARTPLVDSLLTGALDGYPGRITTHRASLGWFSPVELSGVELQNGQGESLLSIAAVRTDKSLLGLLTGGAEGT